MKRKNRPTVLLPIILVLVILVLIFCLNRDYKRLESRRDQIILKINQIKEGADESFVLEILGGPESRESGDSGMIFRYDIVLGKMPFTVEGASRASINVYFDKTTRKVTKLDWVIF